MSNQLLLSLDNPDFEVRLSAVIQLALLDPDEAIPGLLVALKNSYNKVRLNAAFFLGNIGTKAEIPLLIIALADEDPDVHWSATDSLLQIQKREGL